MTFKMKTIKYLPINWKDGVKLNSTHFTHSYNESIERQQKLAARMTTPFNYGLGESADAGGCEFYPFWRQSLNDADRASVLPGNNRVRAHHTLF